MTPAAALSLIVRPTLAWLAGVSGLPLASREAEVMLLAIGWQESRFAHRRQLGADLQPMDHLARGWWQFERVGVRGVERVFTDREAGWALRALDELGFDGADHRRVHEMVAWNDTLACGVARALLWTDPRPLPALADIDAAYAYYIRGWRPGRPRAESWPEAYDLALAAVRDPA